MLIDFSDSKRSSPSLLARQLRLRLVAEPETDIPRNLHNIAVSIHAIATFQALHDYLRPRVAGLLAGSSRLSSMFAALAASGYPTSSSSRAALEEALQAARASVAGSSTNAEQSTSAAGPTRRRSQRLSAKNPAAPSTEGGSNDADAGSISSGPLAGNAGDQGLEDALSRDLLDAELHADFSDEDLDADVYDDEDEDDPDMSISEKTVTLSVAEGKGFVQTQRRGTDDIVDGSKVEAQTPDGTRVATPSQNESASRGPLGRASYAAALKAKPTDWHLQFSMDDQILPLDTTIYGAIHQHELRKKTNATPSNLIWQGIYSIKFKKVPGPAPVSESESYPLKSSVCYVDRCDISRSFRRRYSQEKPKSFNLVAPGKCCAFEDPTLAAGVESAEYFGERAFCVQRGSQPRRLRLCQQQADGETDQTA